MKPSKRTNSRKIPKSQADVDRAYEQGVNKGLEMFLDVTLLTFDDMGLSDEFVEKFNIKFNSNLKQWLSKRISQHDIREALLQEKGWSVGIV